MINLFKHFFYYRPFADRILCHFLRSRLTLPDLDLKLLLDEFDQHPIAFQQLPVGEWSTPLADLAILLKLVVCTQPKRLLEVGSFRGYTALFLAQHTTPEARIVTVDCYPSHGEAYRGTPYSAKIERRVGQTSAELFQSDSQGSYDLIFIDADHSFHGIKNDTELVMPLVSSTGFLVWHDYANWGYFDGKNGVPEYLGKLALQFPIAHIVGSDLAIYSPAWSSNQKLAYQNSLQSKQEAFEVDPWSTNDMRG